MKICFNAGVCALLLSGLILLPREGLAQAADLVCTACVQESDLGNGAVSAAKLKPGAATNGKIANSAVNTVKIATGAVTAPKIAAEAVNITKLAASAVSTEKIQSGAVTASRLADGAVSAAKLGIPRTTYIEDSGDDVANCDELRDVFAGLTGPAAVALGPGTYDCGANTVVLTAGISLIGLDRGLVTITGALNSSDGLVSLQGADAHLQGVTVINQVTSGQAFAITVSGDVPNWRLSDIAVEAVSSGGTSAIGVLISGSNCRGEIHDAHLTAGSVTNSRGIESTCSGPITATNVTTVATGGGGNLGVITFFGSGVFTLRNSTIAGTSASVQRSGGTLRVIGSELNGSVNDSVVCVGSYDETGTALADGTNGSGGCI